MHSLSICLYAHAKMHACIHMCIISIIDFNFVQLDLDCMGHFICTVSNYTEIICQIQHSKLELLKIFILAYKKNVIHRHALQISNLIGYNYNLYKLNSSY